ncbi:MULTISPECIES: hypothetical protein [Micrococcus]|uniref:hypothetical protein n=1 Tax=Micrococcus TaxID=1269 RepID=UPI001F084EB5|nr:MULTISPECIES: hypothetical protein [Micrococcus]URI28421.1 hypothetical protein M8233_00960 [Micrococcus yunnanensis]
MTARTPLPSTLAAGAFTTAELHAAGLPWRRTLAADLARICRGVHTAGVPDPCAPDGAAALVRLTGGVVSHVSAALWHGLPLPPRLTRPAGLHLTFDRSARTHRTDLGGVVSHRVRLPSDHVLELPDGQRVTTAARTWFDLAGMLRPHEVDWLIAAGDHLVRPPWTPTGRAHPVATVPGLSEVLARCRGRPGVRLARAALAEVRVGADSPPETFLRLALIRAGLPEPELQVAVDPADPASPVVDLGYRGRAWPSSTTAPATARLSSRRGTPVGTRTASSGNGRPCAAPGRTSALGSGGSWGWSGVGSPARADPPPRPTRVELSRVPSNAG